MAKQIKLGFDKIPVPATSNLEKLLDLNTGFELQTAEGGPIYTEVVSPVSGFGAAANATSVLVNNDKKSPVKKVEQFPETSVVSSSLLGVPRQERQLSLFSDVSTYGLNGSYWEVFRYIGGPGYQPVEWTTRINPSYGPRYWTKLIEVPNEQALAIVSFPVTYTYPFGPNFADFPGVYDQTRFARYRLFIQLGIQLFQSYAFQQSTTLQIFAKQNFLDPNYASIDSEDVFYNTDEYQLIEVFSEIEKWTMAWNKLIRGQLFDPISGEILTVPTDFQDALPGYSATVPNFCQLQSRKAFRYQPGRISGFTYGIRVSTDEGSLTNLIEWGCANSTDGYMFQILGSKFNLVRRSTIPLPESNLVQMGLTKEDQQLKKVPNPLDDTELWETIVPRDKFNGDTLDGNGPSGYLVGFEEVTMWKIEFGWYGAIGVKFYVYTPVGNDSARWIMIHRMVIENSVGYPCLKDPYLRFRYTVLTNNTSNITFPQYIYKYGASYYVDGGDEGTMSNHSYSSNTVVATPIRTKSAIALRPKNYIKNRDGISTTNQKDIIPTKLTVTSDVGIKVSVIDCEGCPGFGYYYTPSLRNGISGFTDVFTISSGGNNLTFTNPSANITSISSTETEIIVTHETSSVSQFVANRNIRLSNTGEEVYDGVWTIASSSVGSFTINSTLNSSATVTDVGIVTKLFTTADDGKKLIADGIYSSYIKVNTDNIETAVIARRVGISGRDNNEINTSANYSSTALVVLANGTKVPVTGQSFTMRLTGYEQVIASSVALTKDNININYLNPRGTDSRHFAEFIVGITDKEPYVDTETGQLLFRKTSTEQGLPLNLDDVLFAEYAQYSANKDRDGYDNGEGDPRYGDVLEIDPQLTNPRGNDSGYCSQAKVVISQREFPATYTITPPTPLAQGTHFLVSEDAGAFSLDGLKNGEIGIKVANRFTGAGAFFDADKFTAFIDQGVTKYYIPVTGDNVNALDGISQVSIKIASISGRWVSKFKVFNYDIFPIYVVFGLRDSARVNNITLDEFDSIGQFSYTPTWLQPTGSTITVVNSGNNTERINSSSGLFESGGLSVPGAPPANFVEQFRLDSAQVDTQLQQPLRPGEVRTSFFVGAQETTEFDLDHVFGPDRNVLTPGLLNTGATFITVKALSGEPSGDVQLNLLTKEQ